MNLGEFRKLTDHLDDSIEVLVSGADVQVVALHGESLTLDTSPYTFEDEGVQVLWTES